MARRSWIWLGQAALALLVAAFVWRALSGRWAEFRSLQLAVEPQAWPIILSALTVWTTYALLIEAWRRLLLAWRQRLGYRPAVRVWCLSNLGRYVPGKIWSVAGLAVLAERSGVKGWMAVAAAVVMQALIVGTGAAIVAATVPGAASALTLAIGIALAAATIAVLAFEPLGYAFVRLVRPGSEYHALPVGTAVVAAVVTLGSWISYGVAFWLLGRALVPAAGLTLIAAVGIFAGGYLVGLLALFAPGGVGVREAVLVALLAPQVGASPAVVLTVASRLLLTVTEVGAALFALIINPRAKGKMVEPSRP
ncbi:MAG: lysylphosphatidylglycerol synthase domain-containing protein [Gemmatimonadales bacterium]